MSEELPHSIKAEQALLGILLYDNLSIERIPLLFKAEHMHDPVHARLCAAMLESFQRGGAADPIMLGERFGEDEAFQQMGGFTYLADLVDHAPGAGVKDFCLLITDLAMRRETIRMAHELIEKMAKDRDTPALDHLDAHERSLYQLTTAREESGPRDMGDVLGEALAMAAEAYQRDGEMSGLSTGLADLDRLLGGLAPGNLVVLAARPSMGKTALAVGIGKHNAKSFKQEMLNGAMTTTRGGVTAIFSLEMSAPELGIRILAEETKVSSARIKRGQLSVEEFGRLRDAAYEIRDVPLYIDATGAISLAAVATRCRRLKRTVGLNLIIIDLLQLMTVDSDKHQSPNERVTMITGGLKALAKELDVPIIALSHLTRKVEDRPDKKPQLADLKESGAIEQDADVVMFLYRHAYYLEREQPKEGSVEHMKWEQDLEACLNEAEIIIGKQRHGPVGTVKLLFDGDTTKFSDTIKDEDYGQAA